MKRHKASRPAPASTSSGPRKTATGKRRKSFSQDPYRAQSTGRHHRDSVERAELPAETMVQAAEVPSHRRSHAPNTDRDVERLLTPKEMAKFLRVSQSWLAKARMRGDGPPYMLFGRSIRYAEGGAMRWMKSCVRQSTSER
jgi:hypothetical protein